MGKTRQILIQHRDWLRAAAARPGCDMVNRINFLMRAWMLDKMLNGSFNVESFVRRMKRTAKRGGR